MRIVTVAAVFVVTGLIAFGGSARAEKSGSIVITADKVDTSEANWEKELKKKETSTITQQNDQWTLYFVAFLKKAAGAPEVQLVFYDEAVKEHDPTNNFPIATQSSAKILVSNISVGPDQGFKPGHTYHVLVTRLVGGREDVYARANVTLK
jgi:hypothetical protein